MERALRHRTGVHKLTVITAKATNKSDTTDAIDKTDATDSAAFLPSILRKRRTAWTAEELAELLSFSRQHIYKLVKQKRIPFLKIGGAIRFDPRSTADWLAAKSLG